MPNRREFLRISTGVASLGFVGSFGTAVFAYLWPNLQGGFGAQVPIGTPDEVLAAIDEGGGQYGIADARSLLVRYDPASDPDGKYADITNGTGVMALYQKCVHLGCKVPWCDTSKWWECPCHGSQYNRWGEYEGGPAPRGLDRFPVLQDSDGELSIDTGTLVTGPGRGTGVLSQPPEGPHCSGA